mgnify:CR=1 FL=1
MPCRGLSVHDFFALCLFGDLDCVLKSFWFLLLSTIKEKSTVWLSDEASHHDFFDFVVS